MTAPFRRSLPPLRAFWVLVCLLSFVCTKTYGWAATPSAADILKAAQQQAFHLQTVSFAVDVSCYPSSTLRFFAKGSKVRFEGNLPIGKEARVADDGVTIFAFDDSLYQEVDTTGKYLAFSRQPLGGDLQSGPCWTPIEQCYRWLRIAEPDFRWSTMRDPAVWSKLLRLTTGPVAVPEEHADVYSIVFQNNKRVSVRVHFDPQHAYYPISWETVNPDGEVVERCSADNFQRGQGEAGIAFVPLIVHYALASHGTAYPAQTLLYSIHADSLHINEEIEESKFTLDSKDFPVVDTIFDRDRGTMKSVTTGSIRILQEGGTPVEPPKSRTISAFVIVNIAILTVLIALLIIVPFVRKAKRLP